MRDRELENEERYEQALENLAVTEDTKWVLKYLRGSRQGIKKSNEWLAGIFMVLIAILWVLAKAHWDQLW